MGDLLNFSKPTLCRIAPHAFESLMYVIYSETYYVTGLAMESRDGDTVESERPLQGDYGN